MWKDGIFRFYRTKQACANVSHDYLRSKGKIKFHFISEIPMEETQLTTAMDIICGNVSQGINGNSTAQEVWKTCFPELNSGSISIESLDEGESWAVWISDNPLAFQ